MLLSVDYVVSYVVKVEMCTCHCQYCKHTMVFLTGKVVLLTFFGKVGHDVQSYS